MFASIARAVLAHRRFASFVLIAVVAVSTAFAVRVQADFSAEKFFGGADSEAAQLAEFKERWGSDAAWMLFVARATQDDLLRDGPFDVLAAAEQTLRDHPLAAQVVGLPSSPMLFGAEPGVVELASVAERRELDAPDDWRARVLTHPLAVPRMLSVDGRVAAIAVELAVDADDISQVRPAVLALRDALAPLDGQAGVQLQAAGIPAVRTDFFGVIFEDQMLTVPLICVVVIGLLFGLFRRVHGVLAPGLAAAIPTAVVFGLMGAAGEPIGILNQSYVTLLPAIAVADAIHLVSRFHEELRARLAPGMAPTDEQRHEALVAAVSAIGMACLMTSSTTGIGFFSLQLAEMPILRSFGLYAALGIFAAYGTVLLVIPLMLSRVRGAPPARRADGRLDRWLAATAELGIRHSGPVLLGAIAVAVLAGLAARHVVVDNTLTGLLADGHPTTEVNRLVDDELGGILDLQIVLRGEPGSLKDPRSLRAMAALQGELTSWPAIRTTSSVATWASAVQRAVAGEPGLPDTVAGVAQRLLLVEGSGALSSLVDDVDYDDGRIEVRTRDDGGNAFVGLAARVREAMHRHLDPVGLTSFLSGTPVVAYQGINRVTEDLRASLLLAFGVITLLIGLQLRDLRLTLLCTVPNGLPLLLGYGLMGALGWRLDPTPAVVFTVALGIAVDDSIHLVVRYREERGRGLGRDAAIRQAVQGSGRAVTITSLVLAAGFGVNAVSSFPMMQLLAKLGAFLMAAAWVCDLLVLPALLRRFERP